MPSLTLPFQTRCIAPARGAQLEWTEQGVLLLLQQQLVGGRFALRSAARLRSCAFMSRELECAAMTGADALGCPALALLLSQAKREKNDPSCLETSPPATAMVTGDLYSKWSTLPPDLVRRIADSFLHTNDVDCYMDLRAVCPSWRAATDDPKDNASDRRFQLRRWVVLDEPFPGEGKPMLLLNADTGRFRHRKLPLPSDHYVVATTHGGYFVLADKSLPRAASVLNPLTGVVFVKTYGFDPDKFFSGYANDDRGFMVGMAEHMLLVFKPRTATSPCVSKFDMDTRGLWLMQSIGTFAIFVGHRRCLAVDTDKFPGVEANCVYYTEHLGTSAHICRCNNRRVERVSDAVDFVKLGEKFVLVADRPFTIIHLLSSYTVNVSDSQLALPQVS
ncbi:hypothetical protein VPH35_061751 [Triticum aestivum]|uniref:KIB1-4 beta-propeller domain-containing protein n=1 Tax=Aegilops tauschii TaxID=37682 RepID=M8BMZ2_AEGTA